MVSSSAKRWTSSYSRVPRHSGHLISFQRRLLRSVRIDVARQSWQVDGSWLHVFVMAAEGNSNTGLVSVQMMHSRSPLRMSGNLRWLVMMTEDVSSATRYRCPNLNGGLAERRSAAWAQVTHPRSSGARDEATSGATAVAGLRRYATVNAFCLASMAAAYGLFDGLDPARVVSASLGVLWFGV